MEDTLTDDLYTCPELVGRFWEKVDIRAPDQCWPWIAKAKTIWGYGVFSLGKGRGVEGAHRVALAVDTGTAIPKGAFVLHSCDNPACCNPAHLRIGTPRENTRDMISRGRMRFVPHKGEKNGRAVLTASDVREIRDSSDPQRKLAAKWGLSRGHISRIKAGVAWKEVA